MGNNWVFRDDLETKYDTDLRFAPLGICFPKKAIEDWYFKALPYKKLKSGPFFTLYYTRKLKENREDYEITDLNLELLKWTNN